MILHKGWWVPENKPGQRAYVQNERHMQIIDIALEYVGERDLVLQAGAYLGQWPWALSSRFGTVLSFEGDDKNHECAVRNLGERSCLNVDLIHAILGERNGTGRMVQDRRFTGSHHADFTKGTVPVVAIDSLHVAPDLIMLDIEGAEVAALRGALETIDRCDPVIVLEDNKARDHYRLPAGHQQKFMSKLGYTAVARYIKDIVYVRDSHGTRR